MKRGETEVETCRLNGWGIGTRLIGDEGYGPTIIEITGMGECTLLAKAVERRGEPVREGEGTWTLSMREWAEVESAEAWCEHYAPAGECETCTPPADQPHPTPEADEACGSCGYLGAHHGVNGCPTFAPKAGS